MIQEELIEKVKEYIKANKLDESLRTNERAYKRCYLYDYLREETTLSLESIGKLFNRHFTTVLHGINKYQDLKDDPVVCKAVEDVFNHFPKGKRGVYKIPLGTITVSKEVYNRVNAHKHRHNLHTYRATIEDILTINRKENGSNN